MFHIALRGISHIVRATNAPPIDSPTWVALGDREPFPPDFPLRHRAATLAAPSPQAILRALAPRACLSVYLNPPNQTLACAAIPGVAHYFRLADGTVKPLSSDPEPMVLAAGDSYVALNPVALTLADSAAIARFVHLRDYFNVDKLASALIAHLVELAGVAEPPDNLTILVVEAR